MCFNPSDLSHGPWCRHPRNGPCLVRLHSRPLTTGWQDFKGQQYNERLFQTLVILFGIIGCAGGDTWPARARPCLALRSALGCSLTPCAFCTRLPRALAVVAARLWAAPAPRGGGTEVAGTAHCWLAAPTAGTTWLAGTAQRDGPTSWHSPAGRARRALRAPRARARA